MLERLANRLDTVYVDAASRLRARALGASLIALAGGAAVAVPLTAALAPRGLALLAAALGGLGMAAALGGAARLLLAGRLNHAARLLAFGTWGAVSLGLALPAGAASAEGACVLLAALALSAPLLERQEVFPLVALYLATVAGVSLAQTGGVALVAAGTPGLAMRTALLGAALLAVGLGLNQTAGLAFGALGAAQAQLLAAEHSVRILSRALDEATEREAASGEAPRRPGQPQGPITERTRRSMVRERLISDITARLQQSTAVDDVLETAARSLHAVLYDYDVTLRLTPPAEGEDGIPAQAGD